MRSILLLLFLILVLSCNTFSQPAFTSVGEIKVSQSPADDSPPSIAVNNDGAALIVWSNAAQWFHPDMKFNETNNFTINRGKLPVSIKGGKWAILRDSIVNNYYRLFRYFVYNNTSFVDTTSPIFSFINHSTPINWYKTEIIKMRHEIYRGKVKIHAITQDSHYDDDGPMWGAVGGYYIWEWDYSSMKATRTSYFDWYHLWLEGKMGDGVIDSIFRKSLQWRVDSDTKNNLYYSYYRNYVNDSTFSQVLNIMNAEKDSAIRSIQLDTVSMGQINLSHEVIAGENDNVFLLYLKYPSDSLGVMTINVSTGKIDIWKYITNRVKTNQLALWWVHGNSDYGLRSTAEYSIKFLDDGTYVLIFTQIESDQTSDIYTIKLDKKFDILGPPKRINSATTGNQYSPSVAIKGDTVYVAWLDTRNGQRHVYMRRFRADQITDVNKEEAQPTQFAIQGIFPNPFRKSTTVKYSLSHRDRVEVRVFDLLGREVKTLFDGDAESGLHTIQFNAEYLPNSVYQVVLQSGKNIARKNVVVLR